MAKTPEQRVRDFYEFDFPDDFFAFREFLAELPAWFFGPKNRRQNTRNRPESVVSGSTSARS